MDRKRKLAMIVATVSVALGAGQMMQGGLMGGHKRVASAEVKPEAITPLAAGLGGSVTLPDATETVKPSLPDTAMLPEPKPAETAGSTTVAVPGIAMQPASDAAIASETAETLPAGIEPQAYADANLSGDSTTCPETFNALDAPNAMLNLTLLAPCRAGERVVLHHGGLTVTYQTTLTGALFVTLPGMDRSGEVDAIFSDGTVLTASAPLPDLGDKRRFAVQWLDADAFQINAFENGAAFGSVGHISAADPHRPPAGVMADNGYLTLLGDETAPLPMLAQVYTYPSDIAVKVALDVEASVTAKTCNRELLGELLLSTGGKSTSTDLTLAMPDCEAIGDTVVLEDPLPDMTIAKAE